MKSLNKIKIIHLIILSGFIYSLFLGIINTKKYDNFRILKNGNFDHSIIRTDISQYWEEAYAIKRDLENGKSFFEAGNEYKHSYLFPRIIAFYYTLIDEDIKDKNGFFVLGNLKLGIPILNCLIFYLSLLFVSKKLIKIFPNDKIIYFIILFLSIEPTMTQYHSSYWTESIYISIILWIFVLLINVKKKILYNLLIGFLIGLSFLQRNVSIFLIIPIIIYYIFFFKNFCFKPIISCVTGYALVLLFLGYSNFIKTNKFYVIPSDQKDGPYYLLAHQLNNETNEAKVKKKEIWIKENNLDPLSKSDKKKNI